MVKQFSWLVSWLTILGLTSWSHEAYVCSIEPKYLNELFTPLTLYNLFSFVATLLFLLFFSFVGSFYDWVFEENLQNIITRKLMLYTVLLFNFTLVKHRLLAKLFEVTCWLMFFLNLKITDFSLCCICLPGFSCSSSCLDNFCSSGLLKISYIWGSLLMIYTSILMLLPSSLHLLLKTSSRHVGKLTSFQGTNGRLPERI